MGRTAQSLRGSGVEAAGAGGPGPGGHACRGPEALAFVHAFRRHPTAHYPASTCDDLFALGGMAYRLVTDVYPPSPHLEEPGSEVWREGGPGPRPVRELNPRVSPELEALISRLLAWAPEERFNGQAWKAAEALEQVAHRARSLAARPLFVWGHDQNPCERSPEAAQLAAQWDAAARQTLEQREAGKARAVTSLEQRRRSAFAPAWAAAGAAAFLVLVLVLVTVRRPPGEPQVGARMGSREDRSVSVGDSAMSSAISTPAPSPRATACPLWHGLCPRSLSPASVSLPASHALRPSSGERAGWCSI